MIAHSPLTTKLNPDPTLILGAITILLALLVVWACWLTIKISYELGKRGMIKRLLFMIAVCTAIVVILKGSFWILLLYVVLASSGFMLGLLFGIIDEFNKEIEP